MEVHTVKLNNVSVQEVKGSFYIYIPKIWVKEMNIKKGDKLSWNVKEGNHKSLILKINGDKNV
nr:AbrB/MazE/SpoVT family DNA-binding domain-containing protein [Methanobacterium spitsbergense]